MKVKISDVITANVAIESIKEKELPIKLSYWLASIQIKTKDIYRLYREKEFELIKKYGAIVKEDIWEVKKEEMSKFSKEVAELQKVEEEVSISPLKISLFDGNNFTKDFFVLMDKFIENDMS